MSKFALTLITTFLFIFSTRALAGDRWLLSVAGGVGAWTAQEPRGELEFNAHTFSDLAAELRVVGGLCVTAGLFHTESLGEVQYSYTDRLAVQYTGTDVDFKTYGTFARVGIKVRILNFKYFHLYSEGGVYSGVINFKYDAKNHTEITGSGTNYITSEYPVDTGTYADVGIDILPGDTGFRIGARVHTGQLNKVQALDEEKVKHIDGIGYLAAIQQF